MSKKIAIIVLAVMTIAGFVPAHAQTTSELQAQIAALLAQINALQSQLGNAGGTSAVYSWVQKEQMLKLCNNS
jgi:uncharacterized protein YidB (DUF937 family)